MSDKKIQARNKFVGKISKKIDKLNQDIKLLLEVDQALNLQVGGGLLDRVVAAINTPSVPATTGQASINYTNLSSEAANLTSQLEQKITTLENTLGVLLTHISKNSPYDLNQIRLQADPITLANVKAQVARLDSSLDANKFEVFNRIYDAYANGNSEIVAETYKGDFTRARELPNEVKELLHKAIVSARQGQPQQPPADWR